MVWEPIQEPLILASLAGAATSLFAGFVRVARRRASQSVSRIVFASVANGCGSFAAALVAIDIFPDKPYMVFGAVMFAGYAIDVSTDETRKRIGAWIVELWDDWIEIRRNRRNGGPQ